MTNIARMMPELPPADQSPGKIRASLEQGSPSWQLPARPRSLFPDLPSSFPDRLQHEHEANTPAVRRLRAVAAVPQPPVAAKKPYQVTSVNGSREDEYYWLRDDKRENPEMLAYVKAENAYADAMLAHIKPLETKVYNEIIGRLQQDDSTVPYLMNGYWYFRRFETGKEYPIYSRRADAANAPEEILLNVNELSKGHDFFEIGDIAISPDSKLMAWAEDTVGRRQYVVKVMELATRKVYPIALPNVENNVIWAGDNQTFFYIEKDPETLLGFRVRSHRLDSANHTDVAADPLVWTQEDESFYTQLTQTKDEKFLLIHTQSTVSSEVWYADAAVEEAGIQGVPAARARP